MISFCWMCSTMDCAIFLGTAEIPLVFKICDKNVTLNLVHKATIMTTGNRLFSNRKQGMSDQLYSVQTFLTHSIKYSLSSRGNWKAFVTKTHTSYCTQLYTAKWKRIVHFLEAYFNMSMLGVRAGFVRLTWWVGGVQHLKWLRAHKPRIVIYRFQ